MFKRLKKQDGFTLLELLIVIVIIGILAVLIVPNLTLGPARARDAQRKSDLRNIKTALETYFNDNNSYPTAGAASCVINTTTCLGTALSGGATVYIKALPTPPNGGYATAKTYTYTPGPVSGCAAGACTTYMLTVGLENTSDSAGGAAAPANGTTPNTYTVNSVN